MLLVIMPMCQEAYDKSNERLPHKYKFKRQKPGCSVQLWLRHRLHSLQKATYNVEQKHLGGKRNMIIGRAALVRKFCNNCDALRS